MKNIFSFFFVLFSIFLFSQEVENDSILLRENEDKVVESIEIVNTKKTSVETRITPKKAALYSAILPGLGQYHNKKYWKIPIALGGIGTGVGIAIWNQDQYKRYKTAFEAELKGQPHEFSGISGVNADVLGRSQDRAKRQRDYAIAITSLVYLLNILDAVVDAHLYEGRKDPDLVIAPAIIYDQNDLANTSKVGFNLSFRF